MTEEEPKKAEDRFGLPKMSTNQEVAISFTLFTLGILMVASVLYPLSRTYDTGPVMLGMVMIAAGYFFALESIREFEEKDHYLSEKLMGD